MTDRKRAKTPNGMNIFVSRDEAGPRRAQLDRLIDATVADYRVLSEQRQHRLA